MVASIGFFSPLPLAMMIPFMATQSLAMGEAFGKSFQYGKRKISAMSNEEFNNYSMSKMMDEQTSNYNMIIPKLHEQMVASQSMQHDIFTEMLKIIPTFMNALLNAFNATDGGARGGGTELPFGGITIPDSNIVAASTQSEPTDLTLVSHENLLPLATAPTLTTQEQLQFQQLIETASDHSIQSYFDNISSYPNWKKSLIAEQYNKRGLNPQNLQLDTSTLITGLQSTAATAESLYHTKYTGELTALLSLWLEMKEGYIFYRDQYAANQQKWGSTMLASTIRTQNETVARLLTDVNNQYTKLLIFLRERPLYSNVNTFREKVKTQIHYIES